MDLLRLDTTTDGVVFIRPERVIAIAAGEDKSKSVVRVDLGSDITYGFEVDGDVEEVAAMFECNFHAARISRIN